MPVTINHLPYELLSQILDCAIYLNEELVLLGLCDPNMGLYFHPLPDARMQYFIEDSKTRDRVRWAASSEIRQVNSRWHQLALKYSVRDLNVFFWRGSERYIDSGLHHAAAMRHLRLSSSWRSCHFLAKTANLLENHPTLSSYIRRIQFDGYYEAKESAMIFGILRQCEQLEDLVIPWTALRHGTVADWSSPFGSNAAGPRITALEIRANNLAKRSPALKKENNFCNNALDSPSVDFTHLVHFKLVGNSRFMTITDRDLMAIARTANNIRVLQMLNAASLGPKGIEALVRSSRLSLEVLELEHSPQMEPEETERYNSYGDLPLSQLVAQAPLLRRLKLQSLRTCRDIFACDDIAWAGNVQICLGNTNSASDLPRSDEDTEILYRVLDRVRHFMDLGRQTEAKSVQIEIFASGFVFEPKSSLVHGDFQTYSEFGEPWLVEKKASSKCEQMAGYIRKYPFCITEDEFKDGLNKGFIWV